MLPLEILTKGELYFTYLRMRSGYVAGEVHGLIAATEDQTTIEEWDEIEDGTVWGCYENELSGADGTAIGTGAQNTLDILAGCSEDGIAAKLSADYEVTEDGVTYDDWFLPSKNELNLMYRKQQRYLALLTSAITVLHRTITSVRGIIILLMASRAKF